MATTIDEKIKALEDKLKQEKAKKRRLDAVKKASENKAKRAAETRKKILVGAVLLERFERDEALKKHCFSLLEKSLTRDDDRALFGLPALPAQTQNQVG